jgi:hypothetical protein
MTSHCNKKIQNKRVFSGEQSRELWKEIKEAQSIEDLKDALYNLCCKLQEFESKTTHIMAHLEIEAEKKKQVSTTSSSISMGSTTDCHGVHPLISPTQCQFDSHEFVSLLKKQTSPDLDCQHLETITKHVDADEVLEALAHKEYVIVCKKCGKVRE